MRSAPWLTAKRLRAHGLVLALGLWSVYFWNISNPGLRDRNGNIKGADFIHLYTLGSVALEHQTSSLYDLTAQAKLTAARVPEAAGIRYVPLYPPQVSIFFAPLAALPYHEALKIWLVLNCALYGICCTLLWRTCPQLHAYGWHVLFLAAAFPGFFQAVVWGQTSVIALACFTESYLCFRKRRSFLAGLAIGCLIFKPQLGIASACVFVATRKWKVAAGAVVSAAFQALVAAFYFGWGALLAWARTMWNVVYSMPLLEPRLYQTHSLRTFWTMLVPEQSIGFALYAASAAGILGLTIATWMRKNETALEVRFSSLLLASVLAAPHLIVYDMVVLAPVFLLLAESMLENHGGGRGLEFILYLLFVSPLIGPMARWTHVQISVLLMSGLVYWLWRKTQNSAINIKPARALTE